jgi:hypothetical protein
VQAMFKIATVGAPPLNKPEKWSPGMQRFLGRCFEMNPETRANIDELISVRTSAAVR